MEASRRRKEPRQTISSTDKTTEELNPHTLLLGMKSGPATLENSVAASYKVKHLQLTSEQRRFKLHAGGVHLYVDFFNSK